MEQKTNKKITDIITSSCSIILFSFIIPTMLILFIFLGALQIKYPHESTFSEDLNSSLGNLGMGFYALYNTGVENPKWFYYFFIILGGFIYFTIDEIIDNIKRIRKGEGCMSAQEIIESSDTELPDVETEVKGGSKYTI